MDLYLLRHGLAVEAGTPGHSTDAERPLTKEGVAKMKEIAEAMEELGCRFDLIISSPYSRARQTAEIVARKLNASKHLDFSDALAPHASARELINLLEDRKPKPDSALLVGHEPNLSRLISLLVSGDQHLNVVLKKGGLARLSISSLKHGRCAELEWLLPPKVLRRNQ